MDDDQVAARKTIAAFASDNKVAAIDMTLNKSGSTSPRGYKLNPAVKHTILMYRRNKVVENFALDKLDGAAIKKVTSAAAKFLASGSGSETRRGKGKRRRKKRDSI